MSLKRKGFHMDLRGIQHMAVSTVIQKCALWPLFATVI